MDYEKEFSRACERMGKSEDEMIELFKQNLAIQQHLPFVDMTGKDYADTLDIGGVDFRTEPLCFIDPVYRNCVAKMVAYCREHESELVADGVMEVRACVNREDLKCNRCRESRRMVALLLVDDDELGEIEASRRLDYPRNKRKGLFESLRRAPIPCRIIDVKGSDYVTHERYYGNPEKCVTIWKAS